MVKALCSVSLEQVVPQQKEILNERGSQDHPKSAQKITPPPRNISTVQRKKNLKVGRNDPCPCGSGKKYKLCHG